MSMKRSREPEEDAAASGIHSSDTEDPGTPAAKLVDLDYDTEGEESSLSMKCSMPPHKEALSFRSYEEYEAHYNSAHYSCFVEGCERKCMTPQKRRLHLIDKHMYPKNFFFALTKEGIDGRKSLLLEAGHRRRRSSIMSQPRESRRRASQVDAGNDEKQAEPVQGRPSSSHPAGGGPVPRSEKDNDQDMEGLAGAMSALKFVPRSIRFGRGASHTGFSKK
ncbi:uncharacterized protein DNG_05515 [Cephalotrichum gorgonifer]|uniref:C2H2-type domain-containing protein n=1 Tax=Cephalotrichum gorgonifer TaxID=2041049 RepID=A0AAE8MZT5_9PEZI|nr:uncharacterized protein DNG_05515 [Cephalotrichum gorgonifer]